MVSDTNELFFHKQYRPVCMGATADPLSPHDWLLSSPEFLVKRIHVALGDHLLYLFYRAFLNQEIVMNSPSVACMLTRR